MENFILENTWIIFLIFLWIIPWKGVALWKSARHGQKGWFIVILIINTFAILEILYIFFFSKSKKPVKKVL
ncbi:MAG: DUF5652 family protein [Patescibacteria group bacterium]